MKRIFITALLMSGLCAVINFTAAAQQDSTGKTGENNYTKELNQKHGIDVKEQNNGAKNRASKGRFIGGITFTRFDIGFSKLIDNGSFHLSPQNDFLSYRGIKTSTVSFDVLQFGYRFNSNFKIYLAGGFDWTLIRLKKNITIENGPSELTYINEPVEFSKNRFSSSYVHIPLNFELRSKENDNGKRFYFVIGPEIGFLLNGKMKQISDERGKDKIKDNYHFQSFRYGGTVRLGYGWVGLFTKYYFSDMFDTPAQKGLKNMSFGVSFWLK